MHRTLLPPIEYTWWVHIPGNCLCFGGFRLMGFSRMSMLGTTQIAHKLEHNNLIPSCSEASLSLFRGIFHLIVYSQTFKSWNYTKIGMHPYAMHINSVPLFWGIDLIGFSRPSMSGKFTIPPSRRQRIVQFSLRYSNTTQRLLHQPMDHTWP